MRVYTKIVYDKDDNIIEEHSYNYNGPVSQVRGVLDTFLDCQFANWPGNENYFLKMIIDRGCIRLAGSSKTHIVSWLILIPI